MKAIKRWLFLCFFKDRADHIKRLVEENIEQHNEIAKLRMELERTRRVWRQE